MRRTLAGLVLLALLVGVVAVPVGSHPPPKSLCAVCTELDDRESVGDDQIVVHRTETTVRIDEDGVGHWTTRAVLSEATATALARDDARRRSLVSAAFDGRVAVENPRNLSSTVEGDTLVVTYEVPGMAHRGAGGILVVDFFYGEDEFTTGADEVVVRGPNGTVPTHVPGESERRGGALVVGDDSAGAHTWVDDFLVAFGSDRGLQTRLATEVALGATVLRATVPVLLVVAPVPVGVALAGAAGTAFGGRWFANRGRLERIAVAVGGIACLHVVLAGVAAIVTAGGRRLWSAAFEGVVAEPILWFVLTGTILVAPAVGALVLCQWVLVTDRVPLRGGRLLPPPVARPLDRVGGEWRRVAAVTAGLCAAVVAGGVVFALAGGLGGAVIALAVAPGLLFLPLGVADRCGRSIRHLLRALVILAPVGLVVAIGPVAYPSPVLFVPWAELTVAIGLFAYAAGRRERIGSDAAR